MFMSRSFYRRRGFAALGLAALTLIPIPHAKATPLTYRFTGIGTGTFNGISFTDQPFTWLGQGDTANEFTYFSSGLAVPLDSATFTVSGFPTAIPTNPFDMVSLTDGGTAFLNDSFSQGSIFTSPALAGWDPATAIGPVMTDTGLLNSAPVASDQGPLFLHTISAGTFTASAAPEPASLTLLAVIVLSLVGSGCRSRGKSVSKR